MDSTTVYNAKAKAADESKLPIADEIIPTLSRLHYEVTPTIAKFHVEDSLTLPALCNETKLALPTIRMSDEITESEKSDQKKDQAKCPAEIKYCEQGAIPKKLRKLKNKTSQSSMQTNSKDSMANFVGNSRVRKNWSGTSCGVTMKFNANSERSMHNGQFKLFEAMMESASGGKSASQTARKHFRSSVQILERNSLENHRRRLKNTFHASNELQKDSVPLNTSTKRTFNFEAVEFGDFREYERQHQPSLQYWHEQFDQLQEFASRRPDSNGGENSPGLTQQGEVMHKSLRPIGDERTNPMKTAAAAQKIRKVSPAYCGENSWKHFLPESSCYSFFSTHYELNEIGVAESAFIWAKCYNLFGDAGPVAAIPLRAAHGFATPVMESPESAALAHLAKLDAFLGTPAGKRSQCSDDVLFDAPNSATQSTSPPKSSVLATAAHAQVEEEAPHQLDCSQDFQYQPNHTRMQLNKSNAFLSSTEAERCDHGMVTASTQTSAVCATNPPYWWPPMRWSEDDGSSPSAQPNFQREQPMKRTEDSTNFLQEKFSAQPFRPTQDANGLPFDYNPERRSQEIWLKEQFGWQSTLPQQAEEITGKPPCSADEKLVPMSPANWFDYVHSQQPYSLRNIANRTLPPQPCEPQRFQQQFPLPPAQHNRPELQQHFTPESRGFFPHQNWDCTYNSKPKQNQPSPALVHQMQSMQLNSMPPQVPAPPWAANFPRRMLDSNSQRQHNPHFEVPPQNFVQNYSSALERTVGALLRPMPPPTPAVFPTIRECEPKVGRSDHGDAEKRSGKSKQKQISNQTEETAEAQACHWMMAHSSGFPTIPADNTRSLSQTGGHAVSQAHFNAPFVYMQGDMLHVHLPPPLSPFQQGPFRGPIGRISPAANPDVTQNPGARPNFDQS